MKATVKQHIQNMNNTQSKFLSIGYISQVCEASRLCWVSVHLWDELQFRSQRLCVL